MVCTPDLYYQEFVVSGAELRQYKHKFLKRLDMYHDLIFDEKEKVKPMNPEDFFNGAWHKSNKQFYKSKRFYKIIEDELEANSQFKDYYLRWGHRVYAFVSDPNNVRIDFKEAKKQGASFVISKFKVENNSLMKIVEIKAKENLFLYKIN